MTHFLQSAAWARFQQALGRTVITDSGEGWQCQAIVEKGRFNTRLYCPYGPQATSAKAFDLALASLKKSARLLRVTFIRVEPTGDVTRAQLRDRHFKYVSYNQLQPEHTQLIDLTGPADDIVAAMQQNNRNIYRNYHKKGLSINVSTDPADITIFTDLIHRVATRTGMRPHSNQYFHDQATTLFPTGHAKLFYVVFDDRPIAAAIVFDGETTRYYAHAAADDTYRKLGAGTALLAHLIIDAKRQGLTSFDLFGIAPNDDPTHRWAGFTKFKKSFGGTPKAYVGAWDLPMSRFGYSVYRLYQQLSHRR